MLPSGSLPPPVNCTASGAVPVPGVAFAEAVGAWLAAATEKTK